MTYVRGFGLLVAIAMASLVGCENPAMQKRTARREKSLQQTASLLAECEADLAERLGRTLDELRERHERDVARTRENPSRIQRRLQDDADRWQARQPVHRNRIRDELKGDPANIERTLPKVLD